MTAMSPDHRSRVISSLTAIQAATGNASNSHDDMSAYIFRLTKHILDSAKNGTRGLPDPDTSVVDPAGLAPEWTVSSTSEIIREQLWHHTPVSAPQPYAYNTVPQVQESQAPLLDALFPAPDDDIW